MDSQDTQAPQDQTPVSVSSHLTFLEQHGISPVLFGIVVLILIVLLYQGVAGLITILLFGTKPTEATIGGIRIAQGIGQVLFMLLPTLLLVRLVTKTPGDFLKLTVPKPLVVILPLIGIASLQQVLQIYLVFQEQIPIPESLQEKLQPFKELIEEVTRLLVSSHTVPELLFVMFIVAVIPATAEEFLFRGLIQRSFEKGMTPAMSALLSGVIFGLYHLNPFSAIPLIVLGLYLSFLALRANNLLVSVAGHFFNNAIACIAVYFHVDDDSIITGNPNAMSTTELLGTCALFLLIFIGATYLFVRATVGEQPAADSSSEMPV